MSDISMGHSHGQARDSRGKTALYYSVFSIHFIFSVVTGAALRLTQDEPKQSVWEEAKQAAHATAGYAVKY